MGGPSTGEGVDRILGALQERARELSCLYRVHEICNRTDASLDEILRSVIQAVPHGWQYPGDCSARIETPGILCETPGLERTPWVQSAPIRVQSVSTWRSG